jgi:hypothetical protein
VRALRHVVSSAVRILAVLLGELQDSREEATAGSAVRALRDDVPAVPPGTEVLLSALRRWRQSTVQRWLRALRQSIQAEGCVLDVLFAGMPSVMAKTAHEDPKAAAH